MQAAAKPQASPISKTEECYFTEKEEVGRGSSEGKSMGEEQEFRVTTVSHWLSCRMVDFTL